MVIVFGEQGVNILDLSMEQYNSLFLAINDNMLFSGKLLNASDEEIKEVISIPENMTIQNVREQIQDRLNYVKSIHEEMNKANASQN